MLPLEAITHCIVVVCGQRLLLDADLAALYGVETKRFNEAIKRNLAKFPGDFLLQLSAEEFTALRSQFLTLDEGKKSAAGGTAKYLPHAFT